MAEQPAYYNDALASLAEAERLLASAVSDRKSPMHTPTLGTVDAAGVPRLRTVVLRHFQPKERLLRFHTDARSNKVAELSLNPACAFHFYNPAAKVQLRLTGQATLHRDTAFADEGWVQSKPFSRACYRIEPGSSAEIDNGGAYGYAESPADDTDPNTAYLDPGRQQFVAVAFHYHALEWLYLAHGGHRRVRFSWENASVADVQWLVP